MINAIDIETYKSKNDKVVPYCACCIFNNSKLSFYGEDVIFRLISSISSSMLDAETILYIHNLNFDGTLILECLNQIKIKYDIFVRKLNLYNIKIYINGKILVLKCSYKFLPMSLRDIGMNIGYDKDIFPYDFVCKDNLYYIGPVPDISYYNLSNMQYKNYCYQKKIFNMYEDTLYYCFRDVEIVIKILLKLSEFIMKIVNNKSIFTKSLSTPSMAKKIFLNKFNNCKISPNMTYKEYSQIIPSLHGGRTEVFSNPHEKDFIHYFDFPGMYGTCMLEKFPIGCPRLVSLNDFTQPGFYSIEFESSTYIPCLPYKTNSNSKLIFPNGKLNGLYWYEEIICAIEYGGIKIKKIDYALVYQNMDYVFENYIKCFNEIRKIGGESKTFAKLMINSLYGGMSFKNDDIFTIITSSDEEVELIRRTCNVKEIMKLNNNYLLYIKHDYKVENRFGLKKKKDEYSNIALASAITSKARSKLYKGIVQIIKNNGRLHYVDTDCYVASFDKNNVGITMGDIKWSSLWDDAFFVSAKFYGYIENNVKIVKCRGVKRGDANYDQIKRDFYNNIESIDIKNNLYFDRKDFNLSQKKIEKKMSLFGYDKRIFLPNKKETIPLEI